MNPPPLPSVTAEEFLAQLKAQQAEQESELTISEPYPEQPEEQPKAPKKSNRLFSVLALSAVFALGGIAGSTVTNRYELLKADGKYAYRLDRLTGKMWLVAGIEGARPIPER